MTLLGPKIVAARAVGGLARRAGRGGGTSLPGKLLVGLDRHAIGELAGRLPDGCAVVSATNGKTTTAAMTASVLKRRGLRLVHNRAGSNMTGGVASALLDAAGPGGEIEGQLGLFEVDEFWLGRLVAELRPRAILLSNLFRDQLDRYGELEATADRWAVMMASLPANTTLVLNADDPLIGDLGRVSSGTEARVRYYGIEDSSVAAAQMQHAADSKHCRRCGHLYRYEAIYLGHLGVYECENCGGRRPTPSVAAEHIRLEGTRAASFELRCPRGRARVALPLPGLYNVYNALGAAALCLELGTGLDAVAEGLEVVTAAFGRAERLAIGPVEVAILLMKNPAGANEILRTLALEGGELDVLAVLNDGVADGRDVSWIWDADFELLQGRARRITCAGRRAGELAVRLKYAGLPTERLRVITSVPEALDAALAGASSERLYVLPTYTALLELRHELAARGHTEPFWR
ncbi:MAG: Mur ligase family protein [Solirubrobacterales bacterium]|nr:Mur ligase family protein [Solirubrobacterales bacterium]